MSTCAVRRKSAGNRRSGARHDNMCIPRHWRPAMDDGRLLIQSPFPAKIRRPHRNDLLTGLAQRIFVAHAAHGSKTDAFAPCFASAGKPLLTLDSPANGNLAEMGAEAFNPTRNLTELVPHGA